MSAYHQLNSSNDHGKRRGSRGFALIELSILLVIIGLIIGGVGGVFVGKDMVRTAIVRDTVAALEPYEQMSQGVGAHAIADRQIANILNNSKAEAETGFTLIELSIVLVIIGLIVGGVLVGQDLISAAETRATVAQIERYNSAVNTFRGKYNNQLPGDIDATDAANFGFLYASARGGPGAGDGNGVIEGACSGSGSAAAGISEGCGETAMFWVDLSTAQLIDGGFIAATPNMRVSTTLNSYFPQAKLGKGNYIYVWSGGPPLDSSTDGLTTQNGVNYYGLSAVTAVDAGGISFVDSLPGLSPQQAFSIDTKMDDGLPTSGSVIAAYIHGTSAPAGGFYGEMGVAWALVAPDADPTGSSTNGSGAAITPSPTTCYDNGGGSNTLNYSLSQTSISCGLSFKFQ